MPDALDLIKEAARIGRQNKSYSEPQFEPEPEMEMEEPKSILSSYKPQKYTPEPKSNPVTSSLVGAANFLDIPRSMVADTIALENPFDQLLTPFSDKNRNTSRDVMRKYGMIGEEDTWGNFGAGLAADIVTDPLSWLTLGLAGAGKGVATGGGRAIAKSGADKLAKEAAIEAGKAGKQSRLSKVLKRNVDEGAPALTNRSARSQATPRDILMKVSRDKGKDEAARLLKQLRANGLTDDQLDVSIGGSFMINKPFGSKGIQKDWPINGTSSQQGRLH